jgi:hypothetical protein
MKYFHRTSLPLDLVMSRAADYFTGRMTAGETSGRSRRYTSALGQLSVGVEPEGGHYTRITVETAQPGESELDKVAKRFLSEVHTLVDQTHVLRGGY